MGEGALCMDRKEELIKLFEGSKNMPAITKLIDEALFLENKMEELQKLPFIKLHPNDPTKQKSTPAARLYTQLSGQYKYCLRSLVSLSGQNDLNDADSPLREWAKKRMG